MTASPLCIEWQIIVGDSLASSPLSSSEVTLELEIARMWISEGVWLMRYLGDSGLLGIGLVPAITRVAQAHFSGYWRRKAWFTGVASSVCTYGYYSYYPYACAPYGYYGRNLIAPAALRSVLVLGTTVVITTADTAAATPHGGYYGRTTARLHRVWARQSFRRGGSSVQRGAVGGFRGGAVGRGPVGGSARGGIFWWWQRPGGSGNFPCDGAAEAVSTAVAGHTVAAGTVAADIGKFHREVKI